MKRLLVLLLFVVLITAVLDTIGLTSFNIKIIIDQIILNLAMLIDMSNIQPILNNIDNFIIGAISLLSLIPFPDITFVEGLLLLLILGLVIDKFRSLNNDVNLLEQRRLKMDNNYQKQLHHIIKRMHDLSSNNTSNSSNELSQKTIKEIKQSIENLRSTYLRSKIIRRDLYSQNYRAKDIDSLIESQPVKKKSTKSKTTKKKVVKKAAKKVAKKVSKSKSTKDKVISSSEKESIKELVNENQISQIDLARTYLESGDKAKAEEIIIAVINTGEETEKHEARLLYMQLRK
jgi:FimV-like protein